jgi:hypothetical protein
LTKLADVFVQNCKSLTHQPRWHKVSQLANFETVQDLVLLAQLTLQAHNTVHMKHSANVFKYGAASAQTGAA